MKCAAKNLVTIVVLAIGVSTYAETIKFPTGELARESVLPVFDKAESVKNRNIVTAGRFEFGGGVGFSLMDPFYNLFNSHVSTSYYINEIHGLNITGTLRKGGLSSYGEQLKSGEGLSGDYFDLSKAPSPKHMVMFNYQYTAYYGKISLSKQFVMNLSAFGVFGIGTIALGDKYLPALNVGVGEKFYLLQNLALRLELRLLAYRGPDPTSRRLLPAYPEQPVSAFDQTIFFQSMMTFGLVYLL